MQINKNKVGHEWATLDKSTHSGVPGRNARLSYFHGMFRRLIRRLGVGEVTKPCSDQLETIFRTCSDHVQTLPESCSTKSHSMFRLLCKIKAGQAWRKNSHRAQNDRKDEGMQGLPVSSSSGGGAKIDTQRAGGAPSTSTRGSS